MNMKQWFLPRHPTVSQIERISPSNFTNFEQCKLKAVLASIKTPRMLPSGPAQHLGNIAHKTLKESCRKGMQLDECFEIAWQMSVQEEEAKIGQSWFEKHLIPIKNQQGYDEKKEQCRVLFKKASSLEPTLEAAPFRSAKRRHEVWLDTEDGRVGGYVDEIAKVDRGEALIDYKSGKIFDETAKGTTKVPNEHDLKQVKLYAALYFCNYKVWPKLIRLASLDGSYVDVPFTAEECLLLLVESYQLLADVNTIIGELTPDNSAIVSELSMPSAKSCTKCSYRPCCAPYWAARTELPAEPWPFDFCGKIIELKELGNKSLLVKLIQKNEPAETITIRGLTPDRHPALTEESEFLAFFSALPDKAPHAYHEGKLTTVYSLPRELT